MVAAAIHQALLSAGQQRYLDLARRYDLRPLCHAHHVFQARESLWALHALADTLPPGALAGRALGVADIDDLKLKLAAAQARAVAAEAAGVCVKRR